MFYWFGMCMCLVVLGWLAVVCRAPLEMKKYCEVVPIHAVAVGDGVNLGISPGPRQLPSRSVKDTGVFWGTSLLSSPAPAAVCFKVEGGSAPNVPGLF